MKNETKFENIYNTETRTLNKRIILNFPSNDTEFDGKMSVTRHDGINFSHFEVEITLQRIDLENNQKITYHTFYSADSSAFSEIEVPYTLNFTYTATPLSTPIDTEMSDTSENPVQNKVVKNYVDNAVASAGGGKLYKHTYTVYFGVDNGVAV